MPGEMGADFAPLDLVGVGHRKVEGAERHRDGEDQCRPEDEGGSRMLPLGEQSPDDRHGGQRRQIDEAAVQAIGRAGDLGTRKPMPPLQHLSCKVRNTIAAKSIKVSTAQPGGTPRKRFKAKPRSTSMKTSMGMTLLKPRILAKFQGFQGF